MNPIRSNSGVVKEPINLTAQFMMCGLNEKEIGAGNMTAEQRCVIDHTPQKLNSRGVNPQPSWETDILLTNNAHVCQNCDHQLISLLLELCKITLNMWGARTWVFVVIIRVHMECVS